MDSLTQLVLGAAVGEATLGKKIGNRAILWGGIAGTIPDLDVITNTFMSPINALAFHRGITHSIVFCIAAALLAGWIVPKIYKNPSHKPIAMASWMILSTLVAGAIFLLGGITIIKSIIALLVSVVLIGIAMKRYKSPVYSTTMTASVGDWQKMFWWSFITHPILDCFTTYGTQIFLPFSDYRVSFNNIAVADPLYTLPLLIFLMLAVIYSKEKNVRSVLNWVGIGISSAYMLFTIGNKFHINEIFKNSLAKNEIQYQRYMTTPTILNNVLWSGIAEGDSVYYFGQYSILDNKKEFVLKTISKNHELFKGQLETDYTLKKLNWFSNGFFAVKKTDNLNYKWFDLRFGSFRLSPQHKDEFVFSFDLVKQNDEYILKKQPRGPREGDMNAIFLALWTRIKGI